MSNRRLLGRQLVSVGATVAVAASLFAVLLLPPGATEPDGPAPRAQAPRAWFLAVDQAEILDGVSGPLLRIRGRSDLCDGARLRLEVQEPGGARRVVPPGRLAPPDEILREVRPRVTKVEPATVATGARVFLRGEGLVSACLRGPVVTGGGRPPGGGGGRGTGQRGREPVSGERSTPEGMFVVRRS